MYKLPLKLWDYILFLLCKSGLQTDERKRPRVLAHSKEENYSNTIMIEVPKNIDFENIKLLRCWKWCMKQYHF